MTVYLESYDPNVAANGLNTNKAVTFGSTLSVTGLISQNGVPIAAYELITDNQNQVAAASYAVSHTIFVNDNVSGTYQVASVSAVFGTASSSGTLQVEVATGTQAIASGTNQLSGTISLAGTANTVVNGTLVAAASLTTISAGARVNLIFGGTVTSLANASITVALKRIS